MKSDQKLSHLSLSLEEVDIRTNVLLLTNLDDFGVVSERIYNTRIEWIRKTLEKKGIYLL